MTKVQTKNNLLNRGAIINVSTRTKWAIISLVVICLCVHFVSETFSTFQDQKMQEMGLAKQELKLTQEKLETQRMQQQKEMGLVEQELKLAQEKLETQKMQQQKELSLVKQELKLTQEKLETRTMQQQNKLSLLNQELKLTKEKLKAVPSTPLDECRDMFSAEGQGGYGELSKETVKIWCRKPTGTRYNVCEDLKGFTGLADNEVSVRLQRLGRFHYEAEHRFWNPKTSSELSWFYATSVNYLFANSLHVVVKEYIDIVANPKFEPVLDYSGGVGNNILYLANKGIKCQYFGIGMAEYKFAQYRVRKRGLEDLVEFKEPYSAATGFKFDPINAALPRDGSLGSIIAMDVLEHIPNYHIVVKAMVESIKVGGAIVEKTPFGSSLSDDSEGEDVRVHVSNGGISMEEAMGPTMKKEGSAWIKIMAQ